MNERLHIALAFDENFIGQFYALATSIFHNNRNEAISIHAITSGITAEEKNDIQRFACSYNADVFFYSVPEGFGSDFVLDGNWTAATYYRLLLPQLLPDSIIKYVYIDTDTLVVGSLRPIFQIDLAGNFVAAVRDRLVPVREDLQINQPFTYFNAGVLLIDRNLWLKESITEKAIQFLHTYPEKVRYADQDALNFLFRDRWLPLDISYNVMYADIPEGLTRMGYDIFLKDKIIIHFTQHRPWKMLCKNPYRHLYHHYLKASPYKAKAKYVDFSLAKFPAFFRIKLNELYYNLPVVKKAWQGVKARLQ